MRRGPLSPEGARAGAPGRPSRAAPSNVHVAHVGWAAGQVHSSSSSSSSAALGSKALLGGLKCEGWTQEGFNLLLAGTEEVLGKGGGHGAPVAGLH